MKQLEIHIDGASSGNPGPAGVGVVICDGSRVIKNISEYIGHATNNVAEYSALICALKQAAALKAENVIINTDSQLLYRQLKKEYRIKDERLRLLYREVLELMKPFKGVSLRNIPREENQGADKLAGLAIKGESRRGRAALGPEVCSLK
ncbi:MAG: ribonuclease HI family protein [Candidatus Omnitrophota bacterium]